MRVAKLAAVRALCFYPDARFGRSIPPYSHTPLHFPDPDSPGLSFQTFPFLDPSLYLKK